MAAAAGPRLANEAVVAVGGEPGSLPPHPLGDRRVAGDAVDGPGEVQRFLDGPDLLMLTGR
jgi:hypothetical protein